MDRKCKVCIHCFGNFEIMVDGIPLRFRYKKSKELLAYLVHKNGSTCNVREIAAVIYEDKGDTVSVQSQLRNLVADIRKTLKCAGCEDILYRVYGNLAIVPSSIECDYYDYRNGKPGAERFLNGEYMSQYSWAEDTGCKIYGV